MGTLFFQKGWFKPSKNNDGSKIKEKNCIQGWSFILIGLILKIYLQILFFIGAFFGRTWIDKQINWCYNTFIKLDVPFDKSWHNKI